MVAEETRRCYAEVMIIAHTATIENLKEDLDKKEKRPAKDYGVAVRTNPGEGALGNDVAKLKDALQSEKEDNKSLAIQLNGLHSH
ncbi:hypothetical protein R1flu_009886 [Riccia fluitans]|uniref:Uncharacterized protein n=1 Tax=Riccia fluitans TaxID=41844 RepID=A0ABD1Z3F4_9MARC